MVFMETSMRLKHFPHMSVECIPMDKEVGDLAPIYFKVCSINFCGLKHFPHMSVECIPMDKEVGDLAPIYFKVCIINFYETEAFPSHVGRVYSYGQGSG